MKGIDVHMSQHIGKKFSALFETLTTLTEDERETKEEEVVYLEIGTGELIVGAAAAAAASSSSEGVVGDNGSTIVTLVPPRDLASPAATSVDEQPASQAQSVVLPSILVDGVSRKKGQHKVKINEDALFDGGGLQQLRSVSPAAGTQERDARRKMLESQISEQGENINTLKQVG